MGRRTIPLLTAGSLAVVLLGVVPTLAQAATPITVSGVVTDSSGQPVEGAEVEAVTWWGRDSYDTYGATATDGAGRYSVTFDPMQVFDGDETWAEDLVVTPPTTRHWRGGADLPPYDPGDSVTLDVELEVRATISGTVTDESGAPVGDAGVRLHNVAREQDDGNCDFGCDRGLWWDDTLRTDANGRFSRWVNDDDLVGVIIEADGFESQVRYDVLPGAGLDIQLAAGEPGFEPVTVSGVLRDTSGVPLAHQPVRLWAWNRSLVDDAEVTETSDNGGYSISFDPLALEMWAGQVSVGTRIEDRHVLDPAPSGYYEPGAHYAVDVQVEPTTITGTVTTRSGAPIAGVEVGVRSGPRTTTGADGRYTLRTVPGVVWLDYRAAGYVASGPVRVDLDPGEARELSVTVLVRAEEQPGIPRGVRAGARAPRRAWVRARSIDRGSARIDIVIAECRGRDVPARAAIVELSRADTTVIVRRLRPGHRYRCRMQAHNAGGFGPWSRYSEPFRTPRRRG